MVKGRQNWVCCCGTSQNRAHKSKQQNNSRLFPVFFPWSRKEKSERLPALQSEISRQSPSITENQNGNAETDHVQDTAHDADRKDIAWADSDIISPPALPATSEASQSKDLQAPRPMSSPVAGGTRVATLIDVFERGNKPNESTSVSQCRLPHNLSRTSSLTDSTKSTTKPQPKPVNVFDDQGSCSGTLSPKRRSTSTEKDSSEVANDVALKLRAMEDIFDRRQKYKSMFKDAPLYQDYDGLPIRREDEDEHDTGTNGTTDLHPTSTNDSAQISSQIPKSQEESEQRRKRSPKRKSPPPVVFDRRDRSKSASPTRRECSKSPQRKQVPSGPANSREIQSFVQEFAGTGPNRAMWCQMPQVEASGLAKNLSGVQKKLQETLFEVITSEASYYRSLNVLIEVFYKAPSMQPGTPGSLVTPTQKHHLFSNILDIFLTSENLLRAMEACFREDPWLIRLCEIVYDHTENNFDTYVTYVQNQMFQHRTLEILNENPAFISGINELQSKPECAFLNLTSFLILPTQRVPRLCLLISSVLKYAPRNMPVYRSGLVAMAALDRCAREGEAKKLNLEQKERLMILANQFQYKFDAKSLATDSRRLIKEGELGLLTVTRINGSAFRRKLSGITRTKSVRASLFLFNDILVIAKKRRNDCLTVDEYCKLTEVDVDVRETPPGNVIIRHYERAAKDKGDLSPQSTVIAAAPTALNETSGYGLYPFRLIIQSETHPRAEYTLQAKTLSERERWIDAIAPTNYKASEDLLVRDCPQVLIIRSYLPKDGDELELKEGDSVSLIVSLSDGWCKGLVPGGKKGWFPSNVCVEVEDDNVKHEHMQKFLLMDEAKNAYARRKTREKFGQFPKVKHNMQPTAR